MNYPIGIQNFDKVIEGGYLYFDKTDLIYQLVKDGGIFFLSRPRRFGKSMLLSTLECYFQGRSELFKGLAIDQMETEWNRYPVFRLDFSVGNYTKSGTLEEVLESAISSWEKRYAIIPQVKDYGLRLSAVIAEASRQTGMRAVVLVDEYDKPLLDVMDTNLFVKQDGNRMTLEAYNRNILKGLYSVFKEADANLQFVLLTGVTKFSQVSVFSGFNQPDDISLSARFDTLCGITEAELYSALSFQVERMAQDYEMSVSEMKAKLKSQYDGYHFSRRLVGVYNPFSILCAFKEMLIDSFWFKTGSPTYLIRLLAHSDENINELAGKYYPAAEFDDYEATANAPLPMIYQSGYLTIKAYDRQTNSYLLDFPNDEVKSGFLSIGCNFSSVTGTIDGWAVG